MGKVLDIADIRTDGGTQMRAELSKDVYLDYRDKMNAGVEFPPVDVFYDGSTYWLADGFHRFYGAREAECKSIKATIHDGTVRDAILFAVGANQGHGLRRSNQDKKNSVLTLLNDETWVTWSDRKIADAAGVSDMLVATIRKQLQDSCSSSLAAKTKDEPKIGKDGKARKPPKPKQPKTEPATTDPVEAACEHKFDEGACTKCLMPQPVAATKAQATAQTTKAIKATGGEPTPADLFPVLDEHIRQAILLSDRINNLRGRKDRIHADIMSHFDVLGQDVAKWRKACK